MKTPDKAIEASSAEDYEARGFQILARIIARRLMKQHCGNKDKAYPETDDSPASEDTDENIP